MLLKNERFDKIGLGNIKEAQHSLYAMIAREHYVTARVSLGGFRWYSSSLLMEQSIELYVKAFLFYQYKKQTWGKGVAGHKIKNLLISAMGDIAIFKNILENSDYMDLIDDLENGYNDIRFGESQIRIHKNLLDTYDRLMYDFISEFFKITQIPCIDTVIVDEKSREQFMKNLHTPIKCEFVPSIG